MNRNKVSLLVLTIVILSCATVLPFKTVGRNLFYCSAITIIFFSLIKINQLKVLIAKEEKILALCLFLLGLSYYLWTCRFPAHTPGLYMADAGYGRAGVYLMIGAVMVLYTPALLKLSPYNNANVLNNIILVGFIFLTSYALHYHFFVSNGRLRINNSATLSAYLYVYYSLITIYSLWIFKAKYQKILIALVVSFSLYIVILTQTRAALIIYPLILIVSLFQSGSIPKIRKIYITISSLLVLVLTITYIFKPLMDRVESSVSEISGYNVNNSSSIGARISIWRTGIDIIYSNPTGISTQDRYLLMSKLIKEKERGNKEALRNIVYHLHNDLIDTMSLQGVFSGFILIAVYLSMAFYFYKKQVISCGVIMLCTPIIFFGAGDCLFIHDQFIVILIASLIMFTGVSQVVRTGNNIER